MHWHRKMISIGGANRSLLNIECSRMFVPLGPYLHRYFPHTFIIPERRSFNVNTHASSPVLALRVCILVLFTRCWITCKVSMLHISPPQISMEYLKVKYVDSSNPTLYTHTVLSYSVTSKTRYVTAEETGNYQTFL